MNERNEDTGKIKKRENKVAGESESREEGGGRGRKGK
jgi:hypothetical protein